MPEGRSCASRGKAKKSDQHNHDRRLDAHQDQAFHPCVCKSLDLVHGPLLLFFTVEWDSLFSMRFLSCSISSGLSRSPFAKWAKSGAMVFPSTVSTKRFTASERT